MAQPTNKAAPTVPAREGEEASSGGSGLYPSGGVIWKVLETPWWGVFFLVFFGVFVVFLGECFIVFNLCFFLGVFLCFRCFLFGVFLLFLVTVLAICFLQVRIALSQEN